ncbi:MAG: tetratricopeptide repeat protein [Terriglobales bacterium]
MKRVAAFVVSLVLFAGLAFAQSQSSSKQPTSATGDNPDDILNAPMTPPRSDTPAPRSPDTEDPNSYSSSKHGDLTPPPDDSTHPGGDIDIQPSDGVMEMKPWDPHAADKDVEVGIFYFKRSNYRAAEARFRDALQWQDNHAEATYRLALTLEKEGKVPEAQKYYKSYLKILPQGEFAADSKKALDRLTASDNQKKTPSKKTSTSPPS